MCYTFKAIWKYIKFPMTPKLEIVFGLLTQLIWCMLRPLQKKMIYNVHYILSQFWQHLVQTGNLSICFSL